MHYTLTLSKNYFNDLNENHRVTNRNTVKEIQLHPLQPQLKFLSIDTITAMILDMEEISQNSIRKRHKVNTTCFQNKLKMGKKRCHRSLGICKHQDDITFGLISRQNSHIK